MNLAELYGYYSFIDTKFKTSKSVTFFFCRKIIINFKLNLIVVR